MRANIENSSTGGLLPPVDFVYIRHEINWYHALCPGTAPLNATRPCPRKSAPDPLGRGQKWILGRNTPLLCVIVTVNTTLSGGGQPPSPRKSSGLVDDCRLRPVCYAYPLVKVALSRDIDRRTVYRIFRQKPAFKPRNRIFRDASRHWDLLWMSGICSWLFAAKSENNQLRGISGLVSRLYLGFYIPLRKEFGSSKFEPYSSRWQKNM